MGVRYFSFLCYFLLSSTLLFGHAVDQIYGKFSINGGEWRIDWTFDIGYAEGDWDNPEVPQKPRSYLTELDEKGHQLLRRRIAKIMKATLEIPSGGYEISFPGYEKEPYEFPELVNEGAYVVVRTHGRLKKRAFRVGIRDGDRPSFVIGIGEGDDMYFLTLWAGTMEEILTAEEVGRELAADQ